MYKYVFSCEPVCLYLQSTTQIIGHWERSLASETLPSVTGGMNCRKHLRGQSLTLICSATSDPALLLTPPSKFTLAHIKFQILHSEQCGVFFSDPIFIQFEINIITAFVWIDIFLVYFIWSPTLSFALDCFSQKKKYLLDKEQDDNSQPLVCRDVNLL